MLPYFAFGKTINFLWTPTIDGKPTFIDSTFRGARIYDHPPSEVERLDVAGSLGGFVEKLTEWSARPQQSYQMDFAAIEDPSQHNNNPYEFYYIVVNFRYESAGPDKYDYSAIRIYRPSSTWSRINVRPDQITSREQKIGDMRTGEQIQRQINLATADVFRKLRAMGMEQRRLFDLQELNEAVEIRTIMLICLDLSSNQNQQWFDKYKEYKDMYEEVMGQTKVGYDANNDKLPDETEVADNVGPTYWSR